MTLTEITDGVIGLILFLWDVIKFLIRYPFLPRCRICGERVTTPYAGFKGNVPTYPVCWSCRDGWDKFAPVVKNVIQLPCLTDDGKDTWLKR